MFFEVGHRYEISLDTTKLHLGKLGCRIDNVPMISERKSIWYKALIAKQKSMFIVDFDNNYLEFLRVMSEYYPFYQLISCRKVENINEILASDRAIQEIIFKE